jgi:hypothetical protein
VDRIERNLGEKKNEEKTWDEEVFGSKTDITKGSRGIICRPGSL